MAPTQSKICIANCAETHEKTLRSFPIEVDKGPNGEKLLVKQIRVRTLGHADHASESICFLNSYGFIKEIEKSKEFIREGDGKDNKIIVTACMLPFGAGPNISSPKNLLESMGEVAVNVRKTAGAKEQVIFQLVRASTTLRGFQFTHDRFTCVSSDKFIKSPSKMVAGTNYCYVITFLSLTYCPVSQKFKVPRPILNLRTPRMRSVHLEIILKIMCAADSPIKKTLIVDEAGGDPKASVWIHLCNFYKGRSITKTYDEAYFADKCRRLLLNVGISDLWGPTIVVHARGKIPKAASIYFNQHGWALHPIADAAPALSKQLWSVGCEIIEVNAILQGSDFAGLLDSPDIVHRKIKIDHRRASYPSGKWNPFKKTASSPDVREELQY
ncbi:matrix protein [Wufeng Rhinolophus sinicus rubulavirus 1]|uniref:Matrix protein n=1 Tax=Wufeng Rhinolophus sinicus rubulavirus 1 TaxID=2877512 RepID=A0AAE8XV98_9MONO|nr:matrix protein [Wufeng Rhinolophus sinicus rubulavirus 1]